MAKAAQIVSAEIEPVAGATVAAAGALQQLGFRILATHQTISVDAPVELWRKVFQVAFEEKTRPAIRGLLDERESYLAARPDSVVVSADLRSLIKEIAFIEPPELHV